jgi:hypothetical protein
VWRLCSYLTEWRRAAFGKEVAEKYAGISPIVSDRDQKQGMILHSVFLDCSRWIFNSTWTARDKIAGSITGTGLTRVSILSVSGKDPDVLPPADFTPSVTPGSDTTFRFSVTIGTTAVPAGSTLIFLYQRNILMAHP